ncbi:undecaprenyldiphospho-muramoylpentapeptide beta-N-acetylglucosaminyltransferase [bacterium]|nr:undecaprenyldiphospho-muramoylpentapeptide beta-N-acetylglucosaminyltransferase [bacterium]
MLQKILIATGGTGGHIYPALAVADCLKEKNPDVKILFVGTKRMESGLIPKSGYKFRSIHIQGFEREISVSSIFKNLGNLICLASGVSLFKSLKILREFRPQVILGAGGYPCGPVIFAGYLMGIPGVIMEQNAILGLTNRLLMRIVKGAALGFKISSKTLANLKYCVITGTPVRKAIFEADRGEGTIFFNLDPAKKTILAFGGSLGSKNINYSFVKAIKKIEESKPELARSIQILHSTGKRDYSFVLKEKEGLKTDYQVFEYIDDMHQAYAAADLVIQRAGGVSIAEVCCRGLPSIVVPWSGAAGDHQMKNAEFLAKNDAAVVIADNNLDSETLSENIVGLLQDKTKLDKLADNSKRLGKPHASSEVIALLEKVIK